MKIIAYLGGWDAMLVASIVLTAGVCAPAKPTQAQQTPTQQTPAQPEGRIVKITPDAEDTIHPNGNLPGDAPAGDGASVRMEPAYWIGIRGRRVTSPVLRTQFQLADDLGVVVEDVVPDSPAAKAGLRKHDVILNANGEPVLDMTVLQKLVSESGAKPIDLQIIRLAKESTLTIVPEERPERGDLSAFHFDSNANPLFGFRGQLGLPNNLGQSEQLRKMLERFQRQGGLGAQGLFGPNAKLGGMPMDLGNLPNGVAVNITRENDGPTKITVKEGENTWEIIGDDPKSIEQLPDNIRPFVERMLRRQGEFKGLGRFNFNDLGLGPQLEQLLPNQLGQPNDPVFERMEQLEWQLKELQQRFEESE